ncbi:GDSL family lipase [Frankia sp. AgB1.9]|uniref:GDSL-type esterase/lipase family protein n=1 Tax=unclassified Frankia TaxID=2632575 RepID=UPI00193285A5|nr:MULTISPECIES: GDSL-type esterase/lipase family protein [unclassified Frankia]MBL7493062.1 GDSL family lipase [Frankia sp. AgW1.1]MBL7547707.1 GDSL family lipase [Frankia sp. AgB1.9]MBL7622651.1 GDSL family lipase [Frankia sp. AgB1.8]
MRVRRIITGLAAAGLALAAAGLAETPLASASATPSTGSAGTCPSSQWVAAWTASPTDGSVPFDASLGILPLQLKNQTVRMVVTPHIGGSSTRFHLSNRFGSGPLTFTHVTVAPQGAGAAIGTPVTVTFGGATSVTVPGGQDIASDPVALNVSAFSPLSVSIYLAGSTSALTKHWNANATSYLANANTGDLTNQTSGSSFSNKTLSWLYVDGVDVMANARSVVAFGDSITDGFVGGGLFSIPADKSVADKNGRYPDDLQRRVTAAGQPISVVNAGIGSNQLLGSLGLMDGPSGVSRFQADALNVPAVSGVLVLEGINDLGLGNNVTPQQLEDGYTQLIGKTHDAGHKIWLGTITPASNALVDGTLAAPNSEKYREQVNTWIRNQDLADGVVDFDAALRDPAHPTQLLPAYASPDNLHPNLAGYQKMADSIPLDLLATTTCG